jgi:predicted nucleotidyltransferase
LKYGAHTVHLYGSRANGTHGPESDFDIAAFAAVDATVRVARFHEGQYLDAFIYPERILENATEEHLRLLGSKVVLQKEGCGDSFLISLAEIYRQGPKPKPAYEVEMLKVWAHKMARRMERGDDEGNYRRVWLLTAILEDYFHIHGLWWLGPKKALQWLETNDTPTHKRFASALKPTASSQAIVDLVERVTGRAHLGY